MIYNVSYRTDVPAFFWTWWSRRLEQGFVDVRNPYHPELASRLSLAEDVTDAIVYISKDYSHALTGELSLEEAARMRNTRAIVTVNSYDSDMEPNVIRPWNRRLEMVKATSRAVGKSRLTWNYNPILISERYPLEHHLKRLPKMFADIAPYIGEFSFDFVNIYPKVARNAPEIRRPTDEEREELCDAIDALLERYQIPSATCDPSRVRPHIPYGKCNTLRSLLEHSDRVAKSRLKATTLDDCSICGHIAHRDVATYDTCPHACRYCYANADYEAVAERLRLYDPNATTLCSPLGQDETLHTPKPVTYSKPAMLTLPIDKSKGFLLQ